jgi:putative hydrolase of the HAD superfamily
LLLGDTNEPHIYIGDKLQDDAIASRNVGMMGIWLNRKEKIEQNNVLTFHSLKEILDYIP